MRYFQQLNQHAVLFDSRAWFGSLSGDPRGIHGFELH
jgi:hypothetical protein